MINFVKLDKAIQRSCIQMTLCMMMVLSAGSEANDDTGPLSVYVANYPLQYFAEQIGGPDVRVSFPAPADVDPAFWKPTIEQLAAFQKADLVLLNGASYSRWVASASLPASRIVNTSASFSNTYIPMENELSHSHGLAGKHQHGDLAFTTWLDPKQALAQAEAIRDVFVRRRPESATDFKQRFDALAVQLENIDRKFAAIAATANTRPLIFSHPVYQYFIRRYRLNARQVHWEPDEFPETEQWQELRQDLVGFPASWMIWEGAPDQQTVDELKKLGIQSLVVDPCGNLPEAGDYLDVMRENVLNFEKAFSQ